MIVKFLANKSGGGIGSVNYLLDKKRLENGTAKILKGDEQNTRDLIMTMTKKQKTTFAVLSFEEANIPEAQKYELMAEFEKTFCAGLNKDQFNILWVQHTDKGRLELNCIIPKIELSTGKSFNPYFHGSDFHLADLFQNSANLKYGYSDPKDPAKKASVSGSKKEVRLYQDYEKLDLQLKELVAKGAIQDRTELINLLKDNAIEVTRQGDDYISIKLPESKKARRFSGSIYEKQFTSVDELRDIREAVTQREGAFASRARESEYGAVTQRLSDAVAKRALYNAEQYREPKKRERGAQERIEERAREPRIIQKADIQSSQGRPIEAQELRKPILMGSNQKDMELDNDGTRNHLLKAIRAGEERKRARAQRSSERAERVEVYVSIAQQAERTDYRAIAEAYGQRKHRGYLSQAISRISNKLDGIVDSITRQVDKIAERIAELRQPKRETEIELFVKNRPNSGTIEEALFNLKHHTQERTQGMSR